MTFKDNSKEAMEEMEKELLKALEECGHQGEGHAKTNLQKQKAVNTGTLLNSISHKVVSGEKAVYIGTNVEYAPYIEFGTGAENVEGGTTKPSWIYIGEDGAPHKAYPQRPRPYLKPAVTEHTAEYEAIFIKHGLRD